MNRIETERLLLRDFAAEDAEELLAIYHDPEVSRFFDWKPAHREEAQQYIRWLLGLQEQYGYTLWAVVHRADNRLIGRCGFVPDDIEGEPVAEIAYMIASPYWRQGLATEAVKAVIEYAFAQCGLTALVATVHPDNTASQRVAEKAGMTCERELVKPYGLRKLYSIRL